MPLFNIIIHILFVNQLYSSSQMLLLFLTVINTHLSIGHHLCENGWVFFSRHCYHFEPAQVYTFNSSRAQCSLLGGYLVMVGTEEEHNFILHYVTQHLPTFPELRIGMNYNEGKWCGV